MVIATKSVDQPERVLYNAPVRFDGGNYLAYLLLYPNRLLVTAFKVDQVDRVRSYSWKYEQIKSVNRNQDEPSLLTLHVGSGSEERQLEISFSHVVHRNKFAFRLQTLAQIYQKGKFGAPSKPAKSYNPIDDLFIQPQVSSKVSTPCDENGLDRSPKEPQPKMIDPIFSVENLTKLAKSSMIPATGRPKLNDNYDTKITVPIEINAGDSNYSLNAEASLTLKLNIDLAALVEAQKISTKKERIEKIRELIKMDTTLCKLTFV